MAKRAAGAAYCFEGILDRLMIDRHTDFVVD